jgi:hypothetical protein
LAVLRDEVNPVVGRRNLALLILCALGLQMELPIAHVPAHSDLAPSVARSQGAQPLALRAASDAHAPAHDPASCPICRSLHAKPVVPPAAAPERLLPERAIVVHAPAQLSHASPAREGHGPRAPPLSLA